MVSGILDNLGNAVKPHRLTVEQAFAKDIRG